MTTLIAEQPWLTLAMLALLAGAALYGWMQTGKRGPLIVGLVLVTLMPVAWIVAERWVTDREQIRMTIEKAAEALRQNDIDQALQLVDPTMRSILAMAQADLSRFHFSEARVTKMRAIEVNSGSQPPTAEVDITVSALISDRGGMMTDFRVLRRVVLEMHRLDDGQWYVYSYNHMPVTGQPDAYSPNH